MPDLRTLPETLARRGDIVTPPMEAVVRRAHRARTRRMVRAGALVAVVALLAPTVADWVTDGERSSHVRLVDDDTTVGNADLEVLLPPPVPESLTMLGSVASGPVVSTAAEPPAPVGTPVLPEPPACAAGRNGGATDRGVTGDRIRVAMTETLEFPTRYATVRAADPVRRLFEEINLRGGICGRFLELQLRNTVWGPLPWDANGDVVAGLAGPLDPAVDTHILFGSVDREQVPLLGADGRIAAHHRSPWVWPVGPSTAGYTRIAVDHAYRAGARHFALVHDGGGPLGVEAAAAFTSYVQQLPGAEVTAVQPLHPDDDYTEEAARFHTKCLVVACDLVLHAMPAPMATKWLKALPTAAHMRLAMIPEQLSRDFWSDCPKDIALSRCSNLWAWSAAQWSIGSSMSAPALICEELDVDPETVAALVSACALVEALHRVGPHLTRDRLRNAIDEVTYQAGLVRPFRGDSRVPDERVGPSKARALKPLYSTTGEYLRLEEAGTGWVPDPLPNRYPN